MTAQFVRALGLAGAMALGFAASAQAADITLRLASVANAETTYGQAQEVLKEEFEKATNGRVELQIFNNNTLGSNREALELAKLGTVDFVVTGLGHASAFAPQLNAVLFPYIWKDRDTMFEVLDGDVGGMLSDALKPSRMSIVGWWDNGYRHVSNNVRPINKVEDLKGLKLRTLPSSVHVAFFRAAGASPTPMSFNELMPALQQGVLDGQENPPTVVYPYRLFEAQKYYSLTSHVNEPMVLIMSDGARAKLSAEDLAALDAAIEKATAFQRELNDKEVGAMMDKLRGEMEVNDVPPETIEALRQIAAEVYPAATAELGEGGEVILDAIIEANE
ncbi:TRAP transporter substrate-binding protein [Acuticoccus kandeliae]|uniref:TRAP transporter substrate-binding protein n=1 Tax=Acuticoccus kandeliae TaxID=2073160 RepID=UPI000D3E7D71|nr:TRAP transporter substrate-binding protein [Acuticoccus kandeliae]